MKQVNIFTLFLFTSIFIFLNSCSNNSTTPLIEEEPNYPKGKIVIYVINNDQAHTPVPDAKILVNPLNESKYTDSLGVCVFELNPDFYIVEAHLCCAGGIRLIDYCDSVTVIENGTQYLTYTACLACL